MPREHGGGDDVWVQCSRTFWHFGRFMVVLVVLWGLPGATRQFSDGSWKFQRSYRRFLLPLGEDGLELVEHELHYLALENHVDRHVGWLRLGAEQRGSKHDGDTLNRHPVEVLVLDHPGERERWNSRMCFLFQCKFWHLYIITEPGNSLHRCLIFLYTFIQTNDITSFVMSLWDNVSGLMANVSLHLQYPRVWLHKDNLRLLEN